MEILILFVTLALVVSALVAVHDGIEKYAPTIIAAVRTALSRRHQAQTTPVPKVIRGRMKT